MTHDTNPQDLLEAALVLEGCYRFFPEGTVHLVVVDPGVGTERRPIAVDTANHLFVGPDNGIFSRIYAACPESTIHEIADDRYRLPQISDTFHGRDIFAPVAAHLSRGVTPAALGPCLTEPVRRDPPQPLVWQQQITGEVIHVDSFGNVITNISRRLFDQVTRGRGFRIEINGRVIESISRNYQDVERGRPVAVFGSMETIEVAIHGGRANRRLGIGRGDPVLVSTDPQ